MKKTISLLLFILHIQFASVFATIHIISQSNISFSPSSLNVSIGDTVKWVWSSGTHTTTSRNIPTGAESWDSNLDNDNETFMYKVSVAGTYNYVCKPHESMGMTGSFTATGTTSISTSNLLEVRVYPNPASSYIFISSDYSYYFKTIEIVNIIGERVYFENIESQSNIIIYKEIDVSNLRSGIYLVNTILTNGKRKINKVKISGR